ncbi:hypothetical protein [Pseudomonas brassicacearum]|uniref:hypothetical protein n=1 Tax=Pseudomonas brassicacearum TaxID=930166 RepID=UPI0021823947|nr:hypothetical protein [Pseudomonas brassicacearum]
MSRLVFGYFILKTAMHVFEISPRKSIGPVHLGASRSAVRQALADMGFVLENSHGRSDYFCAACLQVEYSDEGVAQFIGISGGSEISFTYKGVDVFSIAATELFSLIAAADCSGSHEFNQYEYCFANQIITLWDADEQYDRQGGEEREVWGQVGIGSEQYLSAVEMLRQS